MKQRVNIELIVAYIEGRLNSSEQRNEVRSLIESNKEWFATYVDVKSSIEELKNTKFEVTPDQLLNPLKNTVVESTPKFDFKWLLKPQIALSIACMLIVVVFVSLNREVDDFELFTEPSTRNLQAVTDKDNITELTVVNNTLKIFNSSTDELTVSINTKKFTLSMFDSLEVSLKSGENRIIIFNSTQETIQDTTINK